MALNVESSTHDQTPEESGFGLKFGLILIALLIAGQLNGLVGLLGGNAQSEIAIHFRTAQIAWFSQISLLVGVFALPFIVKLAGMYGKKRLLVAITALGLAGDLISALSTNYEMLLVGRAVSGFYGPALALAFALARDVFPPRLVGPASGLIGGGVGLIALGGPFISGAVLDNFGFRGVLWFMTIASSFSLLTLLTIVPESPVREGRTRIDWLGGILIGGGATAIIYGISKGAGWGWTSFDTLAFIGGGILAVLCFLLVESKVAHPLFPVTLLRRRRIWATLLACGLAAGAVYATGTAVNLLVLMPNIPGVSDGLGWSATKNAVVSITGSVTVLTVAVLTGVLARRIDSRILLATGTTTLAISYALTSQFHTAPLHFVLIGFITGTGLGMVVSIIPVMIIESVKPVEQALANGAQNMTQGVIQGVLSQVVFVILAQHGTKLQGTQFYSDASFVNTFLIFTGILAVAALSVLLIPRGESLEDVEVGQAVT
jgi:MFS family permease